MNYVDVMVDPTPNPNAYKFTLNRAVTAGRGESYMNKEQAQAHPLAAKLFEIPGVVSVFLLNNFITVTRDPAYGWETLAPEIVDVIQAHFEGRS